MECEPSINPVMTPVVSRQIRVMARTMMETTVAMTGPAEAAMVRITAML
jgi:hypothetical protein